MMSFSWVGPNNLSHGGTEIRNSLHFVSIRVKCKGAQERLWTSILLKLLFRSKTMSKI